jgi:hypothetical protein
MEKLAGILLITIGLLGSGLGLFSGKRTSDVREFFVGLLAPLGLLAALAGILLLAVPGFFPI